MNKIEGIFHILAGGMGAGILIAVLELLYNSNMDAVKSHGEVSQSIVLSVGQLVTQTVPLNSQF